MGLTPATNKQIPDNSILDRYYKQTYLGNAFSFVLAPTVSGTSESPILLLSNPAASTTAFPNQQALFVNLRQITGENAGVNTIIRVYVGPTVTGAGTTQTPLNNRPASATTSIATIGSAPTVSANGSLMEVISVPAYSTKEGTDLIILDPGKQMLITLQSADASVPSIKIGWYEL